MNSFNKNVRVWYLSGGMMSFGKDGFDESNNWRKYIKNKISEMSDGKIACFNPNEHFSLMDDPIEFTDREAMNIDIYKLRNSELVVYNNNDPYSRGSMIELGIAWERRIPIIVLNEQNKDIHPWVKSMAEKIVKNRTDFLSYVWNHYIHMD